MKNYMLVNICVLFLVCLAVIYLHKNSQNNSVDKPVVPLVETQPSVPQPETPKQEDLKSESEPQVSKVYTKYAEALEASKALKRPIFLYFGADWCAYCKKMKSTTLADASIKEKLSKEYVPCFIDTNEDRATSRKFRVAGIPAYMIVDSEETILSRSSGYKDKEQFLEWLKPQNVSFIE